MYCFTSGKCTLLTILSLCFVSLYGLHREDMPEGDKEKRKRAHTEKKKKLPNPLNFVSSTR